MDNIMDKISGEDKTLRVFPSTHVGIMASVRAQYKLRQEVGAWLGERSQ